MARPRKSIPTPRKHKGAAVLDVHEGNVRRCITLGPWGSEQATREYERVLTRLRVASAPRADAQSAPLVLIPKDLTVAEALVRYVAHIEKYYVRSDGKPTGTADDIKITLGYLKDHVAHLPLCEFDLRAFKLVRQPMIEDGRVRNQVNRRVTMIRSFIMWCAGEELPVAPGVLDRLRAVRALAPGRDGVPEQPPREPANPKSVEQALAHLPAPLAAVVTLLRLTGARPSELLQLRPREVDRTGEVWIVTPTHHKCAWRANPRVIFLRRRVRCSNRGSTRRRQPTILSLPTRNYTGCTGHRQLMKSRTTDMVVSGSEAHLCRSKVISMTNDSEWPDRDEEARLLERLLTGCRTSHEEFAACYLHRLCQFLGATYPKAREELCNQAADEALLNFLAKPSSYDATKKGLSAYLHMSAECDLLNLLAREARHRPVSLDSVAEPVARRNRTSGCESPLDDPRVAAEYSALAPNERGVLELMCEGVRDTDEYAEVLGLLHLSAERRRAEVKRTKDRIQNALCPCAGRHAMSDQMFVSTADPHMERFAHRASANPAFLGWQLAAFARARGFDDAALAAYLGCECAALDRARLCRPIRAEHRRADVTEVATKFGLNPVRLAEATKPVPAEPSAGDTEPDPAPAGAFLAARDRTDAS